MTLHYHGTPITPLNMLYELAGRCFCVRFGEHRNAAVCHDIGQSVMLDNGAFSFWRQGKGTDFAGFYKWARPWLDYHTTWAVIPDVIEGTEAENDALISATIQAIGYSSRLAPVWHLHESFDRLESLVNKWDRVCFGSSGEFAAIGTPRWNERMNEAFNRICKGSGRPPAWIHMLRGMSLSESIYPFASVDSTDIARNHHVRGNARAMADRWDAQQNPARWTPKALQQQLVEIEEINQ